MMISNAAISDSKMAMATDSDVGSTSVTIWPRQLPPHWANRISARHSSADRPSLKKESMNRNHTRYLTSSAPTSATLNVVPPPKGSSDAGSSEAIAIKGNAR